jgi:hypothetical protein
MSSRGVLELSSSVHIKSTGWLMQSVLPAEEAFAPIRTLQRQLFGLATAKLAGRRPELVVAAPPITAA